MFFAHRDPIGFAEWFTGKYPGRIEQLRLMAATAAKVDLKELVIGLRLEVANLDPPFKTVVPDLECAKGLPF